MKKVSNQMKRIRKSSINEGNNFEGLKTIGEVNLWKIMTLTGLLTSSVMVQTLYQIKEIKA
jgi:hypothetical protein